MFVIAYAPLHEEIALQGLGDRSKTILSASIFQQTSFDGNYMRIHERFIREMSLL